MENEKRAYGYKGYLRFLVIVVFAQHGFTAKSRILDELYIHILVRAYELRKPYKLHDF